jgi:hypothetical protein
MRNTQRLIPIICLIAGLLLIGSELLDTFAIENPEGVAVELVDAGPRHGYALGLLGVVAIAATLLAVLAGSRPAAIAVAVCGLAALALFAAIDLPDVGAQDLIADPNRDYTEGTAVADDGFWMSIGASVLLVIGGGLLASLSREQLASLRPGRDRAAGGERAPKRRPAAS